MGSRRGGPAPLDTLQSTFAPRSPTIEAAVGPLSYQTITPYRSVATPEYLPDVKLASGFYDVWDVWRDINNNPQIPSSIKAVTFNLTVTRTVGAAFLAVIPAGAEYAGISTVNWTRSGVDLANNGTVGVGPDASGFPGCVVVGCGGTAAATHYLLDITGYYT